MGFDGLLGNERLKENLTKSLAKGHISHCYLISGPEGSGKRTLAWQSPSSFRAVVDRFSV